MRKFLYRGLFVSSMQLHPEGDKSVRTRVYDGRTGAFLGVHLLISASLTFGYAVRISSIGPYLAAVAYDVGANALTAEWLFRGAVFSHWWQRWQF